MTGLLLLMLRLFSLQPLGFLSAASCNSRGAVLTAEPGNRKPNLWQWVASAAILLGLTAVIHSSKFDRLLSDPLLPHVLLVHANQDILWLYVGVYDLALGVKVVEAFEDLLHHDLHIGQVDPLVVASNDEFEQIMTQHLKINLVQLYLNQFQALTSKTMQIQILTQPLTRSCRSWKGSWSN